MPSTTVPGALALFLFAAPACQSVVATDVAAPPPAPREAPQFVRGSASLGDSLIPAQGNGGYDVRSYDLAIELETPDGPIRGTTTIDALATESLQSFNLDFHGLTVDGIEVDGAPASFTRAEDELTVEPAVPLASGASFRAVVRYSGQPEGVKDPAMPVEKIGWFNRKGETYVFSQPSGAMTFFPCNNHPKDKALYTLRIGVPKPLEVVANGVLVETLDQGERRTFVWRARDPMATYLVTLAIAEFDEAEIEGPNGLKIVNYFVHDSKESGRKAFDRTDEIVDFLSRSFGPYPFEICGNVLTNLPVPGALETQTKPIYGRGTGVEEVICHELAHQWFGDAVCVEDWNDIWINEGFAEYAAWMYVEATGGKEKFEKKLQQSYAMARMASAGAPGTPGLRNMFGVESYVRGPLVLHAVRLEMGDERFLAMMRDWIADHLHGCASVEGFVAHVDEHGGAEAGAVLRKWLYDDEMPAVAAWDEAMAKQKAEADERKKAREEERRKKKEQAEKPAAEKPKDG